MSRSFADGFPRPITVGGIPNPKYYKAWASGYGLTPVVGTNAVYSVRGLKFTPSMIAVCELYYTGSSVMYDAWSWHNMNGLSDQILLVLYLYPGSGYSVTSLSTSPYTIYSNGFDYTVAKQYINNSLTWIAFG